MVEKLDAVKLLPPTLPSIDPSSTAGLWAKVPTGRSGRVLTELRRSIGIPTS